MTSLARWSALAAAALVALSAGPLAAQVQTPEDVVSLHERRLFHRVEESIDGALLATSGDERNAHLDAAEQVARHLVKADSTSADAWYWLSVTLGVRTEFGGPLEKLNTGKEVSEATARVLELDSLHAGGHEMMGRLHAAVMRLPWLVRGLAQRMGMGDALREASWDKAENHFRRACELDRTAIAPRLELAKLYIERTRSQEAEPLLRELSDIDADGEVDRRLLVEGRQLLTELQAQER